jgi:hypothetical protein
LGREFGSVFQHDGIYYVSEYRFAHAILVGDEKMGIPFNDKIEATLSYASLKRHGHSDFLSTPLRAAADLEFEVASFRRDPM